MVLVDVEGCFHIRGLKFCRMVYIYALKSPRRVRSVACKITHLFPLLYPCLAENTGNIELGAVPLVQHYSLHHGLAIYREVTFVNVTSVAENTE